METLSLDGEWQLAYFPEADGMPLNPDELAHYQCPRIPANVPGNVELDLARSGEIPALPELMRGLNLTKLRKYECYDWWYTRTFAREEWFGKGHIELVFNGLDVFATIWLNGVKIGETRNAKLCYRFDVTQYLKDQNTLCIRLAAPLNVVRDKDYDDDFGWYSKYESVYIRKPYHAFGTDINPRVLTGGIWRSVYIRRKPDYEIRDIYVYTEKISPDGKKATVAVSAHIDIPGYSYEGLTADVSFVYGDSRTEGNRNFMRELAFEYVELPHIEIKNPQLWWPLGYGDQPLYDVTLEIFKDGIPVAKKSVKHGIRTIELERTNTNLPDKPGKFMFRVNGERIFIRGCNWIWGNIFHSLDKSTVTEKVKLFKTLHCNMIRMHGGGVYEPPEFYDFCDENGIMIWHDLGMSALPYPQNDEFADLIGEEVKWAVKELRNHPSIAIWCGNNEADQMRAFGWYRKGSSPDDDRVSRRILPGILSGLDPYRPYLPSSPYYTAECIPLVMAADNIFERHFSCPEAHIWGPRDYCKSDFYYRKNRSCFASEIGFPGVSNVSLLKKYLSPDKLWPMRNNPEWNCHGTESMTYRNGTMDRVRQADEQLERFFGEVPTELETYVKASQILQAESDKFLMELYRLGKWHKTGILLWNLADSWPQVISDAYVDSDMNRKLVFYFLQRCSREFAVLCSEPENGEVSLIAANETRQQISGKLEVKVYETEETYDFVFDAKPNDNTVAGKIRVPSGASLLLFKWTCDKTRYSGVNHYVSGESPLPLQTYLQKWLPEIAAQDSAFSVEDLGK